MTEYEGITLPEQVLKDFGCRNCIWKQHDQCPKGYTQPYQSTKEGFCEEMAQFLFSLRAQSKSLSQMREKYHLYVHESESMADRMKFHELKQKYAVMSEDPLADRSDLKELKMAIESYKTWWERLNTNVIKGYARIGDRESRKEERKAIPTHVTIQQFNLMLKGAETPVLEEKNDGSD